jgi:hypothetical protein
MRTGGMSVPSAAAFYGRRTGWGFRIDRPSSWSPGSLPMTAVPAIGWLKRSETNESRRRSPHSKRRIVKSW